MDIFLVHVIFDTKKIRKELGANFLDNREEKWKKEKDKIKTEVGKNILREVVLKRFAI